MMLANRAAGKPSRAFALGMPSGTGMPVEQETKYPRPPRTPTRALPSAAFAALDRPKHRALDPRASPGAVGWRGGGSSARAPPWTKALRGEKELRHAAEAERQAGDAKLAAVAEAAAAGFRRAAQAAEPAAMQASMREARRQATAAVAAEARRRAARSIPRDKLEIAAWGSAKVLPSREAGGKAPVVVPRA